MTVPPLIAIGLDAAHPVLLERWMDAGHLPTLAKIRAAGTYARLAAFDFCRAESACTTFLTGCAPWTTGRWTGFRYHREDYTVDELDAYEFEDSSALLCTRAASTDRRVRPATDAHGSGSERDTSARLGCSCAAHSASVNPGRSACRIDGAAW